MDKFVFVVCQHGAEQPLKQMAIDSGVWRLAFSRPGLLTLKFVGDDPSMAKLHSPLIRLQGLGLGPVKGESTEQCFEKLWKLATKSSDSGANESESGEPGSGESTPSEAEKPFSWQAIHIFERDRTLPGSFRFEPGISPLTTSLAQELSAWLESRNVHVPINSTASAGSKVLDIIVSEPNQWFIGHHEVKHVHEQWPGGVPTVIAPEEIVSRAYLKLAEAIQWSRLPIQTNDAVVEIGSAPGGASQRLLDMGLKVTGIDAAEMDERIAKHPRFEHWRSKAAAVKRRLYRKFKWLVCDANVAPNYTLDIIRDIVSYEENSIEGMILTFKLSNWRQLDDLDAQLQEIRALGYRRVEARQFGHNRHELCVVAAKN